MRGMKIGNDYQQAFSKELYRKTPKAIFAAALASIYINDGDVAGDKTPDELLLGEWQILHENGIVPQRPPNAQDIE